MLARVNVRWSIASWQWQSYAVKRQTVLERKRMELEEAASPKGQLGQGVGVVGQGLTGGINLVTGKGGDADHGRQLQEVRQCPTQGLRHYLPEL